MHHTLRLLLPMGVFVVLVIVVTTTLLLVSRRQTVPPAAKQVIPSPPQIDIVKTTRPSAPCLPTSPQFTSLRECTSQHDCGSCSESPTACVTVADPVTVSVAVPPSDAECSGHGRREGGVCVCDESFSGDLCEFGKFAVDTPGQYCLPAYLGKCDEFTSDTVLSADARGNTTWSCRCKQSMAGIFTQSVEGGNCDLQVACGAPVGVQALVNVGSLEAPRFETRTVHPNRLTSKSDRLHGSEPCVYKTTTRHGEVVPDPAADPTCVPRLYSNKCTVSTGGGNTQVIRGSGAPGDPEVRRVSPPFRAPVPPELNRCPDGWQGRGTANEPCTDGTTSFALFSDSGEWMGEVSSVAELRAWWATQADTPWWGVNQVPVSDVNCMESIFEAGVVATAESPDSLFCVTAACEAAKGFRKRAWDGARDGPLMDAEGNPYGGQCACDDDSVPGDAALPSTRWTCSTDMCKSKSGADHLDEATGECVCTTSSEARPFKTSMSYKHPNTPATCVDDPCNPNGVNVESGKACESEADCGGVCVDQQCHIPSDTVCRTDLDCSNQLRGMSQEVARCTRIGDDGLGVCATLDVQRARLGSTCTTDAHCSLGACTGEEGEKTCTGGCACANGFHQVPDGGMSPLGFTCVDDCIGKCKNGGVCVHLEDGGIECKCSPYYGGETCEERLCSRQYEYCDEQTPCCSACPCPTTPICCNRFPREVPEGENTVFACVENVCQETTDKDICLTSTNSCEELNTGYFAEPAMQCNGWGTEVNGQCECLPTHTGEFCETAVCSRKNESCDFDAECCNYCEPSDLSCVTYDTYDGPQKCISGKCKPAVVTERACVPVQGNQWVVSIDAPPVEGVASVIYAVDLVPASANEPNTWYFFSLPEEAELGTLSGKLTLQSGPSGVRIHTEIGLVEEYEADVYLPPGSIPGNDEGRYITVIRKRVAPYYEDTFEVAGSYADAELCTSTNFMRGTLTNSFLWHTSKTEPGSDMQRFVLTKYLELSIRPGPGSPEDVPHFMKSGFGGVLGTDPDEYRELTFGGVSSPNLKIELHPTLNGIYASTNGKYRPDHSLGDFGVEMEFIDQDDGLFVSLEIGHWVNGSSQSGMYFKADHKSTFVVPDARVELSSEKDHYSEILVKGTQYLDRIENPNDPMTYIKFT